MKKLIICSVCWFFLFGCAVDGKHGFLLSVEKIGRTVIAIPSDMAQAAWSAFINRIRKEDEGIPKWREEMPACHDCEHLNQDPELDQEKYFYVCQSCAAKIRDKSPDLAKNMQHYEVEPNFNGETSKLRPVSLIGYHDNDFFPDEESSRYPNNSFSYKGEQVDENVNERAKRLGLDLNIEQVDDDFFSLPDFKEESKSGEQTLKPLREEKKQPKKIYSLHQKLKDYIGIE